MISLRTTTVTLWLAVAVAAAGAQKPPARTFDADRPGAPPEGFTLAAMRQSSPGAWVVVRNGANGYVRHPADEASRGFTMAVAPDEPAGDGLVTVRLRLASGARTGGLVTRYRDAGHYYATVLDLAQGEMTMYRVVDGNRIRIEFREHLELDPDAWHTLKVVHRGSLVYALLGGVRVFEDRQRHNATWPAGRAGLLATGHSDVWFDDLRIEPDR